MKKMIYNICMVVFEITLPLFLLMGTILVLTQLVGAVIGNGAIVLNINTALKTYSIWAASVCALSGFIMSYVKEKKTK